MCTATQPHGRRDFRFAFAATNGNEGWHHKLARCHRGDKLPHERHGPASWSKIVAIVNAGRPFKIEFE